MMNASKQTPRRVIAGAIVLVVIIGTPLTFGFQRASSAHADLESARSSLAEVARNVQELINLRSHQERISLQKRPPQDVIAQVNAVLAEIGLPAKHLQSLSPESDTASESIKASESKVRRQSLRLTLANLNVQDLGAFLAQWRQAQSIWTVTQIELTHVRSGGGKESSPDDNRYDASILISALYLDGS